MRHDDIVVVLSKTVFYQVFENIDIGMMNMQVNVHIAADILYESIVNLFFVVADFVKYQ
ncbi:hypothetical protein D3C84_1200850 [compost metagenome]